MNLKKIKKKESKAYNFNTCSYLKVSERKQYMMNDGKLIGGMKLGKELSTDSINKKEDYTP